MCLIAIDILVIYKVAESFERADFHGLGDEGVYRPFVVVCVRCQNVEDERDAVHMDHFDKPDEFVLEVRGDEIASFQIRGVVAFDRFKILSEMPERLPLADRALVAEFVDAARKSIIKWSDFHIDPAFGGAPDILACFLGH